MVACDLAWDIRQRLGHADPAGADRLPRPWIGMGLEWIPFLEIRHHALVHSEIDGALRPDELQAEANLGIAPLFDGLEENRHAAFGLEARVQCVTCDRSHAFSSLAHIGGCRGLLPLEQGGGARDRRPGENQRGIQNVGAEDPQIEPAAPAVCASAPKIRRNSARAAMNSSRTSASDIVCT